MGNVDLLYERVKIVGTSMFNGVEGTVSKVKNNKVNVEVTNADGTIFIFEGNVGDVERLN